MVRSILALSLLGLGAINALPTANIVDRRQEVFGLGEGETTFTPGASNLPTCKPGVPLAEQSPCLLGSTTGGVKPGKRSFTLPPDYQTNTKEVIKQLEVELVKLQNKKNKTAEELADIKAIKAALQYLAGITQISAPPGDGTIFVPGKRSFTLPPDYQTNTKEVIKQLEVELVKLQNKKNKSAEEVADIKAIKAALQYLAGITQISAPPGDGTIFVPGKRAVVSYGAECSKLDSAELALESLIHKSSYNQLSVSEYLAMEQLKHYLLACGITIIKSPDGTTTIIKPSDKKRDVDEDVIIPAETEASFDLAGLQEGYAALMEALDGSRPSFTTWLVIQQIADLLEIYGITVDRGLDAEPSSEVSASKRQTIGTKACALTETKGLQTVLAQLTKAYGNPATAPAAIYLVEQFIVTALQLCSTPVAGWTTLTPATPIPGAPIIPDKTIPGAPITPDPYYPGSPIVVSDKRANTEGEADPAALLAALNLLVQRYSAPGAGPIPAPVFLIMVNIASILQGYPGVAIPAWPPVLGPGTVVIGPSS
ncbi:hypothetical protein B0T17DRAFT_493851 [Bombardia bombarda]|uniref:Uncharacterized protein n=1 Tax=Bombardia bombarda TaxID=252184 RepID=A0AA39WUA9_9PEZI|nr:hypothetical protein B0T17DRAFT_493851 [Bombardia bombarda]